MNKITIILSDKEIQKLKHYSTREGMEPEDYARIATKYALKHDLLDVRKKHQDDSQHTKGTCPCKQKIKKRKKKR